MSLVFSVVILLVIAVLLLVLKNKGAGSSGKVGLPYLPAKLLFSAAERSFLGVLDQVVGPEYRVFGKVRVADIAKVKPGLGNSARQGALNRIAAKHFDFVICRASDLAVVCVIELNDKSHTSQRGQARDQLLSKVCKVISLPLLQVPAQQTYSVAELRAQFQATVKS